MIVLWWYGGDGDSDMAVSWQKMVVAMMRR
jgi:hypothetical protein